MTRPRAAAAEVMRALVASGDAVPIGTDAAGAEQLALTAAGLARARRELAISVALLDDETTARAWLAMMFE